MRTRAVIISLGLLVALCSTACGSDGSITKVSGSGSSSGAGGSGSTNSGKVDTPFGDITIPDLGKLPGGAKLKKCTELGVLYASISLGAIGNDASRAKASDAADKLAKEGIGCDVIDLRTTSPIDEEAILDSVEVTGRLVVVDEAPPRCGLAADLCALVASKAFASLKAPPVAITPPHTPIPFARELESAYLPSVDKIEAGVRQVLAWR